MAVDGVVLGACRQHDASYWQLTVPALTTLPIIGAPPAARAADVPR